MKKLFCIISGILAVCVPFVHFTLSAVSILYGIMFLAVITVLSFSLIKKNWYGIPVVIIFCSLFMLGVCIASARIILSAQNISEMPLIGLINLNPAAIMTVGIIFSLFQTLFVCKGCCHSSEVSSRFAEELMLAKMYSIDSQFNERKITKEEADKMRTRLRRQEEFILQLEGSTKLLSATLKAILIIFAGCLIAGILSGKFLRNIPLPELLFLYVPSVSVNIMFFGFASVMLGLAIGIQDRIESELWVVL